MMRRLIIRTAVPEDAELILRFVTDRSKGAGKALLGHLARIAVANDCGRFSTAATPVLEEIPLRRERRGMGRRCDSQATVVASRALGSGVTSRS